MLRKKPQPLIPNIIVISDTHVGCQYALMHPSGAHMDGGGTSKPSRRQKILWHIWREFWDEWVPLVTRGEPYDLVLNGDSIDGVHHDSTTQWSHNLKDQCEAAYEILAPEVAKAQHFYMLRGTEAHGGKSGVEEERIAKRLNAIPDEDGCYARWELFKRLGVHLCHFGHHIGVTSSSAHEVSAVNAELTAFFTEGGRFKREVPHVIVRSHRHRCSEIRLPGSNYYATAFVTAAWQLKTPLCFRIAGARVATPQIGGSLIRIGDEEIYTRHFVEDMERPKVV